MCCGAPESSVTLERIENSPREEAVCDWLKVASSVSTRGVPTQACFAPEDRKTAGWITASIYPRIAHLRCALKLLRTHGTRWT